MPIAVRADVAACLNFTDNNMDRLNQNATYTILSAIKASIRRNSCGSIRTPVSTSPPPIISRARERNNMLQQLKHLQIWQVKDCLYK